MKKYFFLFIAFALLIACDDIPKSDLIGKWQLKNIEKNGVEYPVDTVWYNFQSESIFAVQVYFSRQDSVSIIRGLRTQEDNAISIMLEAESGLSDWSGLNKSFTIDKVGRKDLILFSEEGHKYSFIKF